MNSPYLLIYRTYIAVKGAVDPVLRRWPRTRKQFQQAKLLVKHYLLPSRRVWVQVQAGFAQGAWMHLRIPEEAGFWRGEHEPEVQLALAGLLHEGDVVYDVGAHLGSMALGMARLVGVSGRVVAFEGDPGNVERLREIRQRNQLEECLRIVPTAVWSRTLADGIAFRRGQTETTQGGVEADGQRPVLADGEMIRVPAITLDDFVAGGGPTPQLVKIDVEGGEYEVLRGGAALFSNSRPFLIAEVHHQQAAEQIRDWLEKLQYVGEWKIPNEGFPRSLVARPIERSAQLPSPRNSSAGT